MTTALARRFDPGERASLAFCGAVLLLLAASALRTIPSGVDDLNLMRVFSMDEPRAVEQMIVNLEAGDLDPRGFYNYGFLYQEIAYVLIRGGESVGLTADVRLIAIVMRLVSLSAYLALLAVAFACVKLLASEATVQAALCAAFLASVPEIYRWGQLIHPDTLSAALVRAALAVAFSAHTASRAMLASGVAGLAFGVKYTGAFALPFCLLPYYLSFANGRRQDNAPSRDLPPASTWRMALLVPPLAACCFALSWLATNPYVVSDPDSFYADLRYETHHTATGHGKAESADPRLWWPVWQEQLGSAGMGLVALGFALSIGGLASFWRTETTRPDFSSQLRARNQIAMIGYVAGASIFLLAQVHMREGRYLMHILPAFVVAGFAGLSAIPRRWQRLVVLAATVLVGVRGVAALQISRELAAKTAHPYVTAGHFLNEHFGAETPILADVYSYVPPKFARQTAVLGVDLTAVREADPAVIVINEVASGRWCWKEPGSRFAEGRLRAGSYVNAERVCALQRWLVSGSSPYHIAYEDDGVVIWSREPAG